MRAIRDHKSIGDTWILGNIQKDRYQYFDIFTIKPGIGYFVTKNLEIKSFFINVVDQDDRNTTGWMARSDWQTPLPQMRIFVGLSAAPETQNAVVVETKTRFIGGSYEVNENLVLNLSYARDDRQNSFIRKVLATSLSLKF